MTRAQALYWELVAIGAGGVALAVVGCYVAEVVLA